MTDLVLTRFSLFLLGAFALMLVLTLAFKRTSFVADTKITDWLTALFTAALAALTWALVDVASKTEILSATDKALHLTATATDRMRILNEATQRAWIGPSDARSEEFQAGRPARLTLAFNNTGRVFASYIFAGGGHFVAQQQWSDGSTLADVRVHEQDCMRGLPGISNASVYRGVAYPTTGFSSFMITYNSNSPNVAEADRVIVSEQMISERQIFLFYGCFVYHTGESGSHHTFFCYFDSPMVSDPNHLSFCPFGQDAD
jgi:hypothetical protein